MTSLFRIATDYEVGYPQSRTWVWDEIETFKKEANRSTREAAEISRT